MENQCFKDVDKTVFAFHISNKSTETSSFKSSENIQKKEGGPYRLDFSSRHPFHSKVKKKQHITAFETYSISKALPVMGLSIYEYARCAKGCRGIWTRLTVNLGAFYRGRQTN